MNKVLLSSLFLVAILGIVAPTPGHAALSCSARCAGGSCWCLFCSCGCNGSTPWCGDRRASLSYAVQDSVAKLEPLSGDTGEIDLNSIKVDRSTENGIVSADKDGVFFYTPKEGFTGLDSFTFSACNKEGKCDLATVLIDVLPKE